MENMLKYTELKGKKNEDDDDEEVAAAAAIEVEKSDALPSHRHCCAFYLEFLLFVG